MRKRIDGMSFRPCRTEDRYDPAVHYEEVSWYTQGPLSSPSTFYRFISSKHNVIWIMSTLLLSPHPLLWLRIL